MSEITRTTPSAPNRAASKWTLSVTLTNVYGSSLYQFFDPESQDAIVPLLDHIQIDNIKIDYVYEGKQTSSFTSSGKLMLGSLPLSLNFNYNPKGDLKGWEFYADLLIKETESHSTTIGAVAAHIFGHDIELPDFVADITVTLSTKRSAGLKVEQVDSGQGKKDLLFTAWINLDSFTFEATQYRPAQKEEEKEKPPAERMFMLSVSGITLAKVDLIGDLPQPFDKLLFLYVQKQKGDKTGLTKAEVAEINKKLPEQAIKLQYKNTKKDPKDEDVMIPYGMHFQVLSKDRKGETSVALDYVFGSGSKKKKQQLAITSSSALVATTAAAEGDGGEGEDPASDPGSAKAPFEKTIGPITIRNLGLNVTFGKPSSLSVLMDASVLLGPIGVGLLGFKLTLTFGDGFNLQHLPTPSAGIDGLAVSFDQSPVILAGMFKHVLKTYQGAATLSFDPYLFQAAGFYGTITPEKGDEFTSTFVYFILNGPLATFEFAEIRGVTGGFGYNTSLTFPTVTSVTQFPLIDTPKKNDPESALVALTGGVWFFPRKDSFWLAAGLTILAFEILEVKAVIVIEWDPKIKLGLFGVATADLPSGSDKKFAHVQLGIVAAVDFDAGTLSIEGQLSPDSFVLDPNCHLTGGFGLFYWFGSSKFAGEFVFTIGGYHRSYRPPSQYPNPPRLGISWSYDSSIDIRGEAYFAITPKVCMGGGRLSASLTLGPLYAFFDAYADFLINYKPFHFTAEGGLSVGVRFTLDLWICTVHIGVELSAILYLEGPPIAGRVHVNFWVFGFDVDFGSKAPLDSLKLSLEKFYQQVLQVDNNATGAVAAADDSDTPPAHIFSCNQGLAPNNDKDAKTDPNKTVWRVRGAVFQFTVGCKFAFKTASVVTDGAKHGGTYHPLEPPETKVNSIYAKPMCLDKPLTSSITVTIFAKPGERMLKASEDDVDVPHWDKANMVSKSVPTALWGKYVASDDPNDPSNRNPNQNQDLLNTQGGLVALPMAIQISSPLPLLSKDKIPSFDYKTFFIKDAGKKRNFPTIKDANKTWLPDPDSEHMWEKVRAQWAGQPKLGDGATETTVRLWATMSFANWPVGGPGDVSWDKPNKLLEPATFDTLFLEAPRMGPPVAA